MTQRIIRLVFLSIAIGITTYYMSDASLTNYWYAIWVALVLSAVNVTIKPILNVLSLPITFFTFGLFLLVINALMIMLVDYLLDDFRVNGFWNALLFSLIVSFINWILERTFNVKEEK